MDNDLIERLKKRLQEEAKKPGDVLLDRLMAEGIINERGEVTGKVHRWYSDFAITEVKHSADKRQIAVFRCLKSVFGIPGDPTRYIPRDAMVAYLKEGKKIITARWDERLSIWREGCTVHLSDNGFILCESANDVEDNVGGLPEFQLTDLGL